MQLHSWKKVTVDILSLSGYTPSHSTVVAESTEQDEAGGPDLHAEPAGLQPLAGQLPALPDAGQPGGLHLRQREGVASEAEQC